MSRSSSSRTQACSGNQDGDWNMLAIAIWSKGNAWHRVLIFSASEVTRHGAALLPDRGDTAG